MKKAISGGFEFSPPATPRGSQGIPWGTLPSWTARDPQGIPRGAPLCILWGPGGSPGRPRVVGGAVGVSRESPGRPLVVMPWASPWGTPGRPQGGWLDGWLVGWLVDWLVGWLGWVGLDWLIGWLKILGLKENFLLSNTLDAQERSADCHNDALNTIEKNILS